MFVVCVRYEIRYLREGKEVVNERDVSSQRGAAVNREKMMASFLIRDSFNCTNHGKTRCDIEI